MVYTYSADYIISTDVNIMVYTYSADYILMLTLWLTLTMQTIPSKYYLQIKKTCINFLWNLKTNHVAYLTINFRKISIWYAFSRHNKLRMRIETHQPYQRAKNSWSPLTGLQYSEKIPHPEMVPKQTCVLVQWKWKSY